MTRKVLITGFEPFGGEKINPALDAVRKLDNEKLGDIMVVSEVIPTVFHESIQTLKEAIQDHQPDAVICIGQAGGRTQISLERVAINIDDARIPDNKGNQPVDLPVVDGGPVAYWSTLPVKRIVREIRAEGIPAVVSNTAGTFVCNHLFYGLMHELQTENPNLSGGFIHIPFVPEQTVAKDKPSMSLDVIVQALRIAITTTINEPVDIKEVGGTIH